jgi:hypothetical protein
VADARVVKSVPVLDRGARRGAAGDIPAEGVGGVAIINVVINFKPCEADAAP